MFSCFPLAALLPGILLFGFAVDGLGDQRMAEPFLFVGDGPMEEKKNAPDILERATQATTRPTTVPLNEFILKPDLYCHRDVADLSDVDRLKSLMDILTIEGLQTAVEFFRDGDGKLVITKGHRRISAMRQLAKQNTPGFTDTMPVDAVEVLNATRQDLVCRSVADNATRKDYTLIDRIRACKAMHDEKVEANRAAHQLNYSTKQYLRDLTIALHPWMLAYVEKEDIGNTAASDLLEAAEKVNRVAELKGHLDTWVAVKRQELGNDKKLRSLLTKSLSDHWKALLRDNQPLEDFVVRRQGVQGTIDADAHQIVVEGKLELLTDDLETLETAERKFEAFQKVVREYRQARSAVGGRGAQDVARLEAKQLEALGQQLAASEIDSVPDQGPIS